MVGVTDPEKLVQSHAGSHDASCNRMQCCVPQLTLQVSPYRPGKAFCLPTTAQFFRKFFGIAATPPTLHFFRPLQFMISFSFFSSMFRIVELVSCPV